MRIPTLARTNRTRAFSDELRAAASFTNFPARRDDGKTAGRRVVRFCVSRTEGVWKPLDPFRLSSRLGESVANIDQTIDYVALRRDIARVVDRLCPNWRGDKRDHLVQAALLRVMHIVERRVSGEGSRACSSTNCGGYGDAAKPIFTKRPRSWPARKRIRNAPLSTAGRWKDRPHGHRRSLRASVACARDVASPAIYIAEERFPLP